MRGRIRSSDVALLTRLIGIPELFDSVERDEMLMLQPERVISLVIAATYRGAQSYHAVEGERAVEGSKV